MNERLEQWFNGELDDDELTDEEVSELQSLVYDAVTKKVLSRPGVHTFPTHKTIQ